MRYPKMFAIVYIVLAPFAIATKTDLFSYAIISLAVYRIASKIRIKNEAEKLIHKDYTESKNTDKKRQ